MEMGKNKHIDEALMKFLNNDINGFNELYEIFHKKIYGYCLKRGLSNALAEEIVQEVFIKVWNSRAQIDPSGNVQAYIYSIAKNLIVDEFKKYVKRKAAEDYQIHLLHPTNVTQNTVDDHEIERMVKETLNGLPEKRRLVFEMSRFQGLTNRAIATELGISVKMVEAHISQALVTFRHVLHKNEIVLFWMISIYLSSEI